MIWMLAALACKEPNNLQGSFDAPAYASVLSPEQGGPFVDPVAFVVNQDSGVIMPLDVQHGWIVPEDAAAPYVPSAGIPTGADRQLGPIAAYAPDDSSVSLWVADLASDSLLQVPWISGVSESGLQAQGAEISVEPEFNDADASGDSATLSVVALRRGAAASETWTLSWTGQDFLVVGSQSGRQARRATWLAPYATDDNSVQLLLEGTATVGDSFTFTVDSGLTELPVGGAVQDLWMAPDQSALWALVMDVDAVVADTGGDTADTNSPSDTADTGLTSEDTGTTTLLAIDPASGATLAQLALPNGAMPHRMNATPDGLRIYLSDAVGEQVLQLDLADGLESAALTSIPMPGAVVDAVWQTDESASSRLYVALRGEKAVRVYDLDTQQWVDVNPVTAEIDGVYVGSPVLALSAPAAPFLMQEEGTWETRERDYAVAITTWEGTVQIAQASTGCLAQTLSGAYVNFGETTTDDGWDDQGATSNPGFELDALDEPVQVNPCGGIARSESWRLTYDGSQGNWIVEGSVSGVQAARAQEGQRYVSDTGAISFTIRSGTQPSSDGDNFFFTVSNGTLEIDFDRDGDGVLSSTGSETPLDNPARPAVYTFLAGAEDGGWVSVNRKVGLVLPVTGYDNVAKVDLQAGRVVSIWD